MSKQDDGVGCKKMVCSFSGLDEFTTKEDVLIEILLWLPTKSLIRFKLANKHWLSLIAAHNFSHLHTLRHPNPQHSLLLPARTSRELSYFRMTSLHAEKKLIPFHFTIPNPTILSSCNGLLLLQSKEGREYYVYNPTTRQSRKISLSGNCEYPGVHGMNLAFDPSKSPHYKIVCIRTQRATSSSFRQGMHRCQIELYDSETLTWTGYLQFEIFTRTMCGIRNIKFFSVSFGVHWSNVIHKRNHPCTHTYYDINKNIIRSLPPAQILRRESGARAVCRCKLQESGGHLYHIIIVWTLEEKSVTIYELQADYSQWLFVYHDIFDQLPANTRILSFFRGDTEEASILVFHVAGKIIAYRFSDRSFNEIVDLEKEPFYQENAIQFEECDVYQIGETLANV